MEQLLATYLYLEEGRSVDVYGCFGDQSEGAGFDYYDLYDKRTGAYLNPGAACREFPTWQQVRALLTPALRQAA